jgi:DNA-binding response OmpR family regulator/DNA-binding CsgD family transcriptional regulator
VTTDRRDIALVVDDSPGTLGLLNDALEQDGYTVLVAQSGTSALEIAAKVTPDIVLMDAIMPGLDGFETCRRLKRMQALANVPILFMTGLSETEHVLRALEAGGVDYVTKPVAPAEMLARIRVHLANARLARNARAALDVAGRFLLAIDREGRLCWGTPQALRLLLHDAESLPPEVMARVLPWALRCLELPPGAAQLTLRLPAPHQVDLLFIGQAAADEILLRVVSADPSSDETVLKEKFGLTLREAEVLLWLGHGKANRDIADILGLSPRTVNKHLQTVYEKLGVENRASAAAIVERVLGERRA